MPSWRCNVLIERSHSQEYCINGQGSEENFLSEYLHGCSDSQILNPPPSSIHSYVYIGLVTHTCGSSQSSLMAGACSSNILSLPRWCMVWLMYSVSCLWVAHGRYFCVRSVRAMKTLGPNIHHGRFFQCVVEPALGVQLIVSITWVCKFCSPVIAYNFWFDHGSLAQWMSPYKHLL